MLKNIIDLPTGKLLTIETKRGELETLSIGDYGKDKNIKADFLGYTKELNGVPNGNIKPLSEKWVVTLSTQYGCPQKCTFCDVPNIPFKGNATFDDLKEQLYTAIRLYPNIKYTDRLNIHFARMGEPAFNPDNIFIFVKHLAHRKLKFQKDVGVRFEVIHPVFTTSLPVNLDMKDIIIDWCTIKNGVFNGQAGLQFSINSTNEDQRQEMFAGCTQTLENISKWANGLPDPIGRKYCLNFAYASDFEVNGEKLLKYFDPEKFMCKITPIHNNNACKSNKIETVDGYTSYIPYKKAEDSLKKAGFDVLVFVPSMDEENGCVTCGNAVVAGSTLKI